MYTNRIDTARGLREGRKVTAFLPSGELPGGDRGLCVANWQVAGAPYLGHTQAAQGIVAQTDIQPGFAACRSHAQQYAIGTRRNIRS